MLGDLSGQPQALLCSLLIVVLTLWHSLGKTELLPAVRFTCQSRKRTLLLHCLDIQKAAEPKGPFRDGTLNTA